MKEWLASHKKLLFILLILVIGGPIIINEAYKGNQGYLTLWGAKEVLAYYGTIVAAFIGVAGVYFTVSISNKNYRDDARYRILPFMAITVHNFLPPDPFILGFDEPDFSTTEVANGISSQIHNRLYFVLDGDGKIRVTENLSVAETKKLQETTVIWRRGKDGNMYLRDAESVSMPFILENIGNGAAKNLRMGLAFANQNPFFKAEFVLKQNEQFLLHIFSEKPFEEIKGNYTFFIYYEDILGNEYEQVFPMLIFEKDDKKFKSIDTRGKQRPIGQPTQQM